MHKYDGQAEQIKVGVVGGSGYAGLEAVRLLLKHPRASLRACFSSHASFTFADYLPHHSAKGVPVVPLNELAHWSGQLDTVFLATPVEVSMELAPKLMEAGTHVIDLSGAFRLNTAEAFKDWYQTDHSCPHLLDVAEYGLVPWHKSVKQSGPRLISNPGCYATSVLMALLPLLKRGLIQPETLVIDSKSGTSGAGRKASQALLFTEVEGECLPYRIGKHQHLPEIRQFAKSLGGADIEPLFTTHLLGIRRGIISGIYAKVAEGVTEKDLSAAYATDYSDYGLVEWGALGEGSERADAYALSLKRVVGSAQTRLHYKVCGGQLYLFSLIDNLIKGAAGQALENFNRIHGEAASLGLEGLEGVI